MMELKVTLEFSCCGCEELVNVTVRCKGADLPGGAVAGVNVPCPTCGTVNRVAFETSGRVRSVRPYTCYRPLPEPSVN